MRKVYRAVVGILGVLLLLVGWFYARHAWGYGQEWAFFFGWAGGVVGSGLLGFALGRRA
jgi:hypothetical protein